MEYTPLLLGDIVFNAKPDAVPFNCRVSYKVTQLCLTLRLCGRADTCSLIKLQMLAHSLMSTAYMDNLIEFTEGRCPMPIVRFDPVVNKALMLSIGYGFVTQLKSGSYKLTTNGHNFAERVLLAGDLMTFEISELKRIGKKLTENHIQGIVDLWRMDNVKD